MRFPGLRLRASHARDGASFMSKAIAEGGNDEVALAGVFETVRRAIRRQVEDAIHRPHRKVTVSMKQRPFARKNKDDLFLEQTLWFDRGAANGRLRRNLVLRHGIREGRQSIHAAVIRRMRDGPSVMDKLRRTGAAPITAGQLPTAEMFPDRPTQPVSARTGLICPSRFKSWRRRCRHGTITVRADGSRSRNSKSSTSRGRRRDFGRSQTIPG